MEAEKRDAVYSLTYQIIELTWQLQVEVNVLSIYRADDLPLPQETYLKFKEHRAQLRNLLDKVERQADTEYRQFKERQEHDFYP